MHHLDMAVVGAGPAGIGMALAFQKVPGLKLGVLEAGRVATGDVPQSINPQHGEQHE